jgi:protein-S-isoprenylcysteine O-methyltransferase Ste14
MPVYAYAVIVAGTLLWVAPFPLAGFKGKSSMMVDRRARWGVLLQFLGYTLLWQGSFWTRAPALWQSALSVLLFAAACWLSWTATRALGRQHRIDAGLEAAHQLIRSGPYASVRHPIYTSMLCVFLGTGLFLAPAALFVPALALFVVGTEIRMRIEEQLLAARFGEQFQQYRREAARWIPWVR